MGAIVARINVHVQPRAAKTAFAGLHDGCVKIRLAAPPLEGAANIELLGFLAQHLRVPKRAVRIVSGNHARRKVVEVDGLTTAAVLAMIGTPPGVSTNSGKP